MKKLAVLCLTGALALTCFGCSSGNDAQKTEPQKDQPAATQQESELNEENNADDSATAVNMKQEVKTDNYAFVLKEAGVEGTKLSVKEGNVTHTYMDPDEGMTYYVVKGKIKNLGGSALPLSSVTNSELTINDKFTFEGNVWLPKASYDIKPLQKAEFWLCFQIPKELKGSIDTAQMSWSFRDYTYEKNTITYGDADPVVYTVSVK